MGCCSNSKHIYPSPNKTICPGSGNPGEAVDTLNILIDHKAPEITQGESVTATVDEDDASTFTLPAITATDPTDEDDLGPSLTSAQGGCYCQW